MELFQGPALFLPLRLTIIVGVIMVLLLSYYNWILGIVSLVLLGVVYLFSLNQKKQQQWVLESYLANLEKVMDNAIQIALHGLPEQILIVDSEGKIHWWNSAFESWQLNLEESGHQISILFPTFPLEEFWGQGGKWRFDYEGRNYLADIRVISSGANQGTFLAFYISDITDYEIEKQELRDSLPVLAHMQIDNYTEVLQGMLEEERNDIILEANRKVSAWVTKYHGFVRKASEDSFYALFAQRSLKEMQEEKISILDDIRELEGENKLPVTLSIGVSSGETDPMLLNERSQSALDLALGRGGDQAVVVDGQKTHFFGGKSKAVEKFTRVKARVVAQALLELIRESDKVFIMGHRQEDFDALGAAFGVARMSFSLGTPAGVLLSSKAPDLEQIREKLKISKEGMQDYFITSEEARAEMTPNSLVVVVDTHRPDSVSAPEILERAEKVVVIDHHRRTENFVANPHLVYLEPSTSSTSELVSELITYLEERVKLTVMEACMLYAGIILDTKNFILQTGSRTLEAASFLRRNGADPQLVQKLFWIDVDSLKSRAEMIANMEVFADVYTISYCDKEGKDLTIIAAQAADLMSALVGVRASFVLYRSSEDQIGISARSQGDMNVQLVMESLGGGGHQMAAAAQIDDVTLEEAKERLKEAIHQYESEE